jgi:hypothetical protein
VVSVLIERLERSASCAGAAEARTWFGAKEWSQRALMVESYG